MQQMRESIYREARKRAALRNENLLVIERAAEALGISVSHLTKVELYMVNPSPELVVLMAEVYKTPELLCMHCAEACPLGRARGMKGVEVKSLDRIAVEASIKLKKSEEVSSRLTKIAYSQELSEEARQEIERIITWTKDIGAIGEALTAVTA